MSAAYKLTAAAAIAMLAQAALGLGLRSQYRDVAWIAATWLGNDGVTLIVAFPLLIAAAAFSARGSARARLVWLGTLAYALYNYAYYLFGATLNAFFPLYLCALISAAIAFILGISTISPLDIAPELHSRTLLRLVGGYFAFVGITLASVWLGIWAAHVLGGRPTPIEPESFKLVAALDIALMVPALTIGGTLLWQRRAWGYVISALAGVQASLYLLVLTVNAILFVLRGLSEGPGEIPMWGTLFTMTSAATVVLLRNTNHRLPTTNHQPHRGVQCLPAPHSSGLESCWPRFLTAPCEIRSSRRASAKSRRAR
jgi:hypothetical protein